MDLNMGYSKVCNQPQPPTTTHKHPQQPTTIYNHTKIKSKLVINSHITALRC